MGNRISEIRRERGFSQEQLAEESGISLRTIQRVEKGSVRPQPFTLKALSKSLRVEISELLDHKTSIPKSTSSPLSIRLMILCSIVNIVPIVSNIIIPSMIYYRDRNNQEMQDIGALIISMQIVWTTTTFLLLIITPSIAILLTGQSTPGNFSPILFVYVLMFAINAWLLIIIAGQLKVGSKKLISRFPRLF